MDTAPLNEKRIAYGWFIVLSGILVIVAVLGFGRFALGMLLPSMGRGLLLGYDQMGFIGTGNFIGYLCAVIFSSRLVARFGYRQVITAGILLVGSSMIFIGFADSYPAVLIAFFITGVGSGAANVPVMSLVSHWFHSSLRGRAAGFIVSGSGIGIMLTGLLVPFVNNVAGESGWRVNWMILGGLSLLIACVCGILIRNRPEDVGTKPLGVNTGQPQIKDRGTLTDKRKKKALLHLGIIYFLFGFTYVIYVTFVITTLTDDYGFSETVAGKFWFWFGLIGIVSGPLFGSLSDVMGRSKTLLLVFSLQASAHMLLAMTPGIYGIYLSVFLFGICAWSVPSIMAATIGDYMGPEKAASAFGTVTLLFGVGQISGPAIAGILAENSGNFSSSYLAAAILAFSAGIFSFLLRKT